MKTKDEIKLWLAKRLGDELKLPAEKLDPEKPFAEYGIDSASAIGVVADLEDYLGQPLDPNLFYSNPSIAELAEHLGSEAQAGAATQDARAV
jgi:acyl carrier protein